MPTGQVLATRPLTRIEISSVLQGMIDAPSTTPVGVLNAAFWSGVSAFVSGRIRHDWVDQVFATAVAGFALMIVSLEILGLAHQISGASVAAVCLATGLLGLWLRRRARSEVALTTASLLDAGRRSTQNCGRLLDRDQRLGHAHRGRRLRRLRGSDWRWRRCDVSETRDRAQHSR
jgi:hypothetical protein